FPLFPLVASGRMPPLLFLLVHILPLLAIVSCMPTKKNRNPKTPRTREKKAEPIPAPLSAPPPTPKPNTPPPQQPSSGNKSETGGKSKARNINIGKPAVAPSPSKAATGNDVRPAKSVPVQQSPVKAPPSPKRRANTTNGVTFVPRSVSCSQYNKLPPTPRRPRRMGNRRSFTERTDGTWTDHLRTAEDHSMEEMTCDGQRTRETIRSIRSRADQVAYQDYTAVSKEERSLVTAMSEHDFEQFPWQVAGNVDEDMDFSDFQSYIGEQLETDQSNSCLQPTDPQQVSAIICGHYRIWLSNKVGSQAEQPPDPQQQQEPP
ncbi:hypothetical protein PFISCL1PPCAC_4284, partial [Pristionchus fissidentatus]